MPEPVDRSIRGRRFGRGRFAALQILVDHLANIGVLGDDRDLNPTVLLVRCFGPGRSVVKDAEAAFRRWAGGRPSPCEGAFGPPPHRDRTVRRGEPLGTLAGSAACSFPGYQFEQLTLPEHLDLVMLHVLTRGGGEDKRWLVRRFGDQGIRRCRGLTIRQMSPWVSERTARRWQAENSYALLWENR